MQHSTPRYSVQPTCYYCRSTGHFKFNCPKLITIAASKMPQMLVALIVSHGRDLVGDEIRAVFGREGGKTGVATPSPVVTSPSLVRSELNWCRPFLCKDTVKIDGATCPVTVLRDTAAQQ
uniref:CCHC-type domain-containing protein n=1 Tax=Scylla olivacea TaxID=85551 RepID=A0A0N7ZAY1_SCYOL